MCVHNRAKILDARSLVLALRLSLSSFRPSLRKDAIPSKYLHDTHTHTRARATTIAVQQARGTSGKRGQFDAKRAKERERVDCILKRFHKMISLLFVSRSAIIYILYDCIYTFCELSDRASKYIKIMVLQMLTTTYSTMCVRLRVYVARMRK